MLVCEFMKNVKITLNNFFRANHYSVLMDILLSDITEHTHIHTELAICMADPEFKAYTI